jgi:hypothetical protein
MAGFLPFGQVSRPNGRLGDARYVRSDSFEMAQGLSMGADVIRREMT